MKLIQVQTEHSRFILGDNHTIYGEILRITYVPAKQYNYNNDLLSIGAYIEVEFHRGYVIQLYDFKELLYLKEQGESK